jgi:hypothetical protein
MISQAARDRNASIARQSYEQEQQKMSCCTTLATVTNEIDSRKSVQKFLKKRVAKKNCRDAISCG